MGILGGGLLNSASGAGGGGGGSGLVGEEFDFVTDTSATTLALIGGQKLTDASGVLNAPGVNSISIINGASAATMIASGDFAVALGHDVTAEGDSDIVIGSGAKSITHGSSPNTVIGASTVTGSSNNQSCSLFGRGITLGQFTASNIAAIGANIAISGTGSSAYTQAFGQDLTVSGSGKFSQILIGDTSTNSQTGAIGVGRGVAVSGLNSVAIGSDGANAVNGAIASGVAAIALGGLDGSNLGAKATGARSQAYGAGSFCSADDAVHFGIGTNVDNNTAQFSGMTIIPDQPTTTRAGFRLVAGTAPTTPVNGDMWTTSVDLFIHIDGTTYTITKT